MAERLPKFLEDTSPKRGVKYKEVQPRVMRPPNIRAVRNLARLTNIGHRNAGVDPIMIQRLFADLASKNVIKSRLEPKSTPGQFRELWIPEDKTYAYILDVLAYVFGSFSTSKETVAFRKDLSPAKGLRMMIDEYEAACTTKGIPKKKNNGSEGHIVGTAYKMDIKSYYDTITYDQILGFLRQKLTQMLTTVLSAEECNELAVVVADLVCPGETLPQGFATSPAIANGVGVKLDIDIRKRVGKLLEGNASAGLRYADDVLLFTSGSYNGGLVHLVEDVFGKHGFKMHPDKTVITRSRDEAGEFTSEGSLIRALGTEIRNDGVGPLRFAAPGRYTREVADAIQWILDADLADGKTFERITSARGHLPRVTGAVAHIANVLRWGMPYGQRLRAGQELMLPKELEKLWGELRTKMGEAMIGNGDSFKIPQPARRVNSTRKMRETMPLKTHEECLDSALKSRTGWKFKLGEHSFVVEDAEGKEIMSLDKEKLLGEGFPEDPDAIEEFLLEQKDALDDETLIIKKKFQAKKIKKLEDLEADPETKDQFYKHYLQFMKWHLVAALNIPQIEVNELMDTDEIEVDDEGKPVRGGGRAILPWNIEDALDDFLTKEFHAARFYSNSMRDVLAMPNWRRDLPEDAKPTVDYMPPERKEERDARGYYVALTGFDLETRSGFPVEKKDKKTGAEGGGEEATKGIKDPIFERTTQ